MSIEISPKSDVVSAAGRAAHDIGLAALLGGNLFGRLAMHPALEGVCGPEERGQVVNAAWRRYGTVNSLSLLAVLGGWLGARSYEAADTRLSPTERKLARGRDVAVAAVAVTGVASAVAGVQFGKSAPGGAVPLESGNETSPQASQESTRIKRVLNGLGRASAASEIALLAVNASLSQVNFRRPPARRFLKRDYGRLSLR
jgi:hypothetical protein